jgi:hypothetical protein
LGAQLIDHPAGGIGLTGQGLAVAFLNEEGIFQVLDGCLLLLGLLCLQLIG